MERVSGRGCNYAMTKRRTSNVSGKSRLSTTVKDALAITSSKRKAKKWSKDKTRQKQKALDDQVGMVYAVGPIRSLSWLP